MSTHGYVEAAFSSSVEKPSGSQILKCLALKKFSLKVTVSNNNYSLCFDDNKRVRVDKMQDEKKNPTKALLWSNVGRLLFTRSAMMGTDTGSTRSPSNTIQSFVRRKDNGW